MQNDDIDNPVAYADQCLLITLKHLFFPFSLTSTPLPVSCSRAQLQIVQAEKCSRRP